MHRFRISKIAVAALLSIVSACGDDEPADPATATSFTATLSGANEVPPVTTTATGTATFEVNGNEITYTITTTTNLQNAILGHIHLAAAGVNGPVRLNLCGTGAPQPACTSGTGVVATGTNGAALGVTFEELLTAMRTDGAYVNIHTDDGQAPPNTGAGDMAGGEIRGQIVPQ